MSRDPDEMIYMRHPDLEADAGPVSLESLQTVHSLQGWVEVPKGEEARTAERINNPNDPFFRAPEELTKMTKAELEDLASQAGVEATGTKEELAKRIAQNS